MDQDEENQVFLCVSLYTHSPVQIKGIIASWRRYALYQIELM